MVFELNSRSFRDCLFDHINSSPRQIMSAEAELSHGGDMITIYKARSRFFLEVTPIYTPLDSTIDLLVQSGSPGVSAADFSAFLETMVNGDQIFSPRNPLHSPFVSKKLDTWKKILRRIPNSNEVKMSCSINEEIKTKMGYNSLMDAFYNYMGLPVLFYLYRMGEFSRFKR